MPRISPLTQPKTPNPKRQGLRRVATASSTFSGTTDSTLMECTLSKRMTSIAFPVPDPSLTTPSCNSSGTYVRGLNDRPD